MRVLLAEDDPRLARTLQRGLEDAGISVDVVADGDSAVSAARSTAFDVMVLDVMLPHRDGFQVCQDLRQQRIRAPIIMLTARDAVEDRVRGLEAGADDYLIKPFSFQELVARIRAQARREMDDRSAVIKIGLLLVDTSTSMVSVGKRVLELTAKEYQILEYFAHHPGQVLTRAQVEEHAWNYDFVGDSNLVEVHIARIRRKLAEAGLASAIITVRGLGYRLQTSPQ